MRLALVRGSASGCLGRHPSRGSLRRQPCDPHRQSVLWLHACVCVCVPRCRYKSDTEEFRCMSLRYDRPELLVGTLQANILRCDRKARGQGAML